MKKDKLKQLFGLETKRQNNLIQDIWLLNAQMSTAYTNKYMYII